MSTQTKPNNASYIPTYKQLNIRPQKPNPEDLVNMMHNKHQSISELTFTAPVSYSTVENEEDINIQDNSEDTSSSLENSKLINLDIDDYMAYLNDKVLFIGSKEELESNLRALIFSQEFEQSNLTIEDIIVVKRVPIKLGLFLE